MKTAIVLIAMLVIAYFVYRRLLRRSVQARRRVERRQRHLDEQEIWERETGQGPAERVNWE